MFLSGWTGYRHDLSYKLKLLFSLKKNLCNHMMKGSSVQLFNISSKSLESSWFRIKKGEKKIPVFFRVGKSKNQMAVSVRYDWSVMVQLQGVTTESKVVQKNLPSVLCRVPFLKKPGLKLTAWELRDHNTDHQSYHSPYYSREIKLLQTVVTNSLLNSIDVFCHIFLLPGK